MPLKPRGGFPPFIPAKKGGAIKKKTASKKTAVKKTASKKTASKKTAVKKTASKKTAVKKTASKKTASEVVAQTVDEKKPSAQLAKATTTSQILEALYAENEEA